MDEITGKLDKLFKKVSEKTVGVAYRPVALIGTQKVNGTNYAVLCETSMAAPGSQDLYAIVILYEDRDGKVTISDVNMSGVRTNTAMAMGGWTNASDPNVSDRQASMLKTAMKGMLGANFAPIALLSTQTASGTNYCFFCEAQSVSADPSSEYAFVYVYEDETGSASVTEILNFVGE